MIIIVKKRNQSFTSIGFNMKTAPKSLLLGLAIAVPVLAVKIIFLGLFDDVLVEDILWVVLYFATYMFVKEILYRGFIQNRIAALIKNKWAAIAVTALMFSILTASGLEFELEDFILHFVLVYISSRDKNILGSFLVYFAWNIY